MASCWSKDAYNRVEEKKDNPESEEVRKIIRKDSLCICLAPNNKYTKKTERKHLLDTC